MRDDGGVGGDDDLSVLRHVLQIVLQPGQLLLGDLLLVLLPVRLAFVLDAVEDDEVSLADVVGEVRRTELVAERIEGVGVIGCVVVLVVVARSHADGAVHLRIDITQFVIEAEVIADIVTEQQHSAGPVVIAVGEVADGSVAGVAHLSLVIGLGVGGDRAVLIVLRRGLRFDHRKVHGLRRLTGRLDASELEVTGAFGHVVVAELCDLVLIDGHLPSGRLSDRDGHVLSHRQFVASFSVGLDDVDSVAHRDAGDALLITVELRVLIDVVEDLAGELLRVGGLAAVDLDVAFVEFGRCVCGHRRGRREKRGEERERGAGSQSCCSGARADSSCLHGFLLYSTVAGSAEK